MLAPRGSSLSCVACVEEWTANTSCSYRKPLTSCHVVISGCFPSRCIKLFSLSQLMHSGWYMALQTIHLVVVRVRNKLGQFAFAKALDNLGWEGAV